MAGFNKSEIRAAVAESFGEREVRGASSGSADAGPPPPAPSLARQSDGRKRMEAAAVIRIDRIIPDPKQPRLEFEPDALSRLAESLKARGQLQPIRVRWDDAADRYVVVVGERRWRAAKLAGMETLFAVVVPGDPSPVDLLEDQLVENCLREDLRPVEQAKAFKALMGERGLTQRQLADRLRIGQGTVSRALALLDLPGEIRRSVDAGEIGPDAAYQLSRVADPAEQAVMARAAARGELRRDEIKGKAAGPRKGRGGTPGRKAAPREFRCAGGKVTVDLRKGPGDAAAVVAVLTEALERAKAMLPAADQAAA